ncbi:CHAP domain protein [Lyngbya aestuarii BL J]|uniref:N-acetylmuramoyl-L-alanine amidase n=1 Tax=Lyngbya aestuarii BL J TaxID=1348334 RepID=U7QRJ8_9CYAN|nr:CHAP domain-containing protein [Lyngbya aestuarii]ERT09041.1 CHAP domain protein [Lyngbya aestuarii BL J]
MFFLDKDGETIAGAGINSDLVSQDILQQIAANQLPVSGGTNPVQISTLVSGGYDHIILPHNLSVNSTESLDKTTDLDSFSADLLIGIHAENQVNSPAHQARILTDALTQSVEQLQEFGNSPDFLTQMGVAFGAHFNTEVAQSLAEQWSAGIVETPPIEVIYTADINGANGAFAAASNTIYISEEFLAQNYENVENISTVLLEEYGHYIDTLVNVTDTPGDEGSIFSGVVQGNEFEESELEVLQAVDDTAIVILNGEETVIEQSSPSSFSINLSSSHYRSSGNKFVRANGTGGTRLWCTDYAFGRALEKGLIQQYSGIGGRITGNAGQWDDQAGSWGRQARPNSFVVWDPRQGGAGSVGHVGFVERVNSNGSFVISEANWGSARMSFNSRTITPGSSAFNTAKFVYLEGTTQPSQPSQPSTSAFRGTVDTTLNVRSGPGTNHSVVGSLNSGSSRTFDAVAGGTTHWDSREQRNDKRWFRLSGTNQWVSASFITGNPLFTGSVDTTLNVRSGPGTSNSIVGSFSSGSRQTFDATTVGTTHWDPKERKNENRWFRIQNTNKWVSAAFITGNPTY